MIRQLRRIYFEGSHGLAPVLSLLAPPGGMTQSSGSSTYLYTRCDVTPFAGSAPPGDRRRCEHADIPPSLRNSGNDSSDAELRIMHSGSKNEI